MDQVGVIEMTKVVAHSIVCLVLHIARERLRPRAPRHKHSTNKLHIMAGANICMFGGGEEKKNKKTLFNAVVSTFCNICTGSCADTPSEAANKTRDAYRRRYTKLRAIYG